MREAISGSVLFYIVIPIIIVFVVFIGFIMRYASTYRAANYVITQIENCQGRMEDCDNINMQDITRNVKEKYSYVTPKISPNSNGIITPICLPNGSGVVYRVELPVEFDVPLLGGIRWMTVKAETKTIPDTMCQ